MAPMTALSSSRLALALMLSSESHLQRDMCDPVIIDGNSVMFHRHGYDDSTACHVMAVMPTF